jgi:hypothetical protein
MKALKRVMAAEYSRELSDRMVQALSHLVTEGLWAGALPGYGLRRMLVGKNGVRRGWMDAGERKALHDEHTVLVPGPSHEIKVIKEIFRLYIDEKRTMVYIASKLNGLGIFRGKVPWNYHAIRKVLFSEKYSGSVVWRRCTQKLKSRCIPLPRNEWVVAKNVIAPVVDRSTFEAARKEWLSRTKQFSDAECLDRLRALLKRLGRLNALLINKSPLTPSSTAYVNRFGSLKRAYELIGYVRTDSSLLRRQSNRRITKIYRSVYVRLKHLFPDIETTHERASARPKMMRFSTGLRVGIAVCVPQNTLGGEKRWRFECAWAQLSGLVTLLCFSNGIRNNFSHFVVVPSASHIPVVSLLRERDPMLSSGKRLKALGHFRRVAHTLGRVSSESPSIWLGRRQIHFRGSAQDIAAQTP